MTEPRTAVLIAGSVQLTSALDALAKQRPVFHSEADFQQAFAWELRMLDPTLRVRLETRPVAGLRLDVLVTSADGVRSTAIELKYLTRLWSGEVLGEHFALKAQGAQDIRAYDVVKDIVRVERFVDLMPGSNGVVVCLGNDSSFWRAPTHGRPTNAAAFRVHDGVRLTGDRAWGPMTGIGSSRGREAVLGLRDSYSLTWHDYSTVSGPAGLFRVLTIPVHRSGMTHSQGPPQP